MASFRTVSFQHPSDLQPAPVERLWSMNHLDRTGSVETLALNDGVALILSNLENNSCPFHFTEPEDVFAIGFHIKGGARFTMPHGRFETAPLDVWAGVSPQGAESSFVLPQEGFRTVSLRFTPQAVLSLFKRHDLEKHPIAELSKLASQDSASVRLSPLSKRGVELINAMFTSPYTGASRSLHLESCALELLAVQIDADARQGASGAQTTEHQHKTKAFEARAWLEEHLTDPPTIAGLARIVGTNEFTLKKIFKQVFGTTIFAYIRQRRMEQAACELNAGRSVLEASLSVGYECPRCFAEAFRRHYGLLPSQMSRR